MSEEDEKIIKSLNEQGEYLISADIMDRDLGNGKWAAVPCYSVFFRKDGIEDWESVETFKTRQEAEDFIASEMSKVSK